MIESIRQKYRRLLESEFNTIKTQGEYELVDRLLQALDPKPPPPPPTIDDEIREMIRIAKKVRRLLTRTRWQSGRPWDGT